MWVCFRSLVGLQLYLIYLAGDCSSMLVSMAFGTRDQRGFSRGRISVVRVHCVGLKLKPRNGLLPRLIEFSFGRYYLQLKFANSVVAAFVLLYILQFWQWRFPFWDKKKFYMQCLGYKKLFGNASSLIKFFKTELFFKSPYESWFV